MVPPAARVSNRITHIRAAAGVTISTYLHKRQELFLRNPLTSAYICLFFGHATQTGHARAPRSLDPVRRGSAAVRWRARVPWLCRSPRTQRARGGTAANRPRHPLSRTRAVGKGRPLAEPARRP